MPESVQTHIDEVTVFNDRALVVRTGMFTAPSDLVEGDMTTIIIEGLPLLIDDTSVRVAMDTSTACEIRDIRIMVARKGESDEEDELERGPLENLDRKIAECDAEIVSQRYIIAEITRWLDVAIPGPPVRDGRNQEKPPFPVDAYQSYLDTMNAMLEKEQVKMRDLEHKMRELQRERVSLIQSLTRPEIPSVDDPSRRWHKIIIVSLARSAEDSASESIPLRISYSIRGARWTPAYTLNISDEKKAATLSMSVRLAQATGEDWHNVRLRFSAASLRRQTQLPDLPSRRIGRSQPPKPAALRPSPEPDQRLLEGYYRWLGQVSVPSMPDPEEKYPDLFSQAETLLREGEMVFSEDSRDKETDQKQKGTRSLKKAMKPPQSIAPPPRPSPQAGAGAMAQPSIPVSQTMAMRSDLLADSFGDVYREARPAEPECEEGSDMDDMDVARSPEPAMRMAAKAMTVSNLGIRSESVKSKRLAEEEVQLLGGFVPQMPADVDYRRYAMHGPEDSRPGKLVPEIRLEESDAGFSDVYSSVYSRSEQLAVPAGTLDDSFFQVLECPGAVDIPADGASHTVPIDVRDGSVSMTWLAAPILDDKVFRRLSMANPFSSALPGGDVSLYTNGSFSFRTSLPLTSTDGTILIPMGVEEAIKITRTVRYSEEESGIISSSNELHHTIEIEVKSQVQEPITIDIIDRIPVSEEGNKHIQIEEMKADPLPKKVTSFEGRTLRGGRLFSLSLAPGEKKTCRFAYRITIPAKMELTGGNRRA